jgi:N utilization substance protein B
MTTKNRTKSRAFAMKFIFQALNQPDKMNDYITSSNGDEFLDALEDFRESYTVPDSEHEENQIDEQSFQFAKKLIQGSFTHWQEINQKVEEKLHQSSKLLDKIDQAILILAFFEMKWEDTPFQVVINESVELAKTYGKEGSAGLVNGVLDVLSRD